MSEGYESIEDTKKSASVRVSESVSDRRMAACVGDPRDGHAKRGVGGVDCPSRSPRRA